MLNFWHIQENKMIFTDNEERLRSDFEKVLAIIRKTPRITNSMRIQRSEFEERARKVYAALSQNGLEVGLVFSDEHYCGDVPYLGGNTNISVEQVAGIIGKDGFHLVAGLEGGYCAEQLACRSGCRIHKAEILQLADEKYPVAAEKLDAIIMAANGGRMPEKIALLSPRQVIPAALVDNCAKLVGEDKVVDAQELYWRIKYEKSPAEHAMIRAAAQVADAVMETLLTTLRPGLLETQVAAWGYFVARELGVEELGFDIMVGGGDANRTLIGKALDRELKEGDYVHLGVGTRCDGLNACIRRSVVLVNSPDKLTEDQKFYFNFVQQAYQTGYDAYCRIAVENLPAKYQEQALVDFYAAHADEFSRRLGKEIDLVSLKPYTGTHNSGYTECQEFFGAITLESEEALGYRIVTMLDVALRGIGNHWNDVKIPGFDYLVVENTLLKEGRNVECVNALPVNVQSYVTY